MASKVFYRKPKKRYSMRFMKSFVMKNIKKAFNRLNYMKRKGIYMVSQDAQTASSMFKMMSRKYGFSDTTYSAKYLDSVTSEGDMGTLFRSVADVLAIDTRSLYGDLDNIKQDFYNYAIKQRGLSEEKAKSAFEDSFDILSKLSSEFHEIFAFITYNQAQTMLKQGSAETMLQLLAKYEDIANSKYIDLDDRQLRYKGIMENKLNRLPAETREAMNTLRQNKDLGWF